MKKGFTLIELIIVVIIIGILATIAIPQYLKASERAKGAKAKNALALIASAEKMYRSEMDTYKNVSDGGFNAALGDYVELQGVDADTDWDYAVSNESATTFTATASKKGRAAGSTIVLTETGVWTGGTWSA